MFEYSDLINMSSFINMLFILLPDFIKLPDSSVTFEYSVIAFIVSSIGTFTF